MNELALFAGTGGGILGGQLVGFRTVCAVEIEPYCASVLVQRQNDGLLPPFPIWDDVRTFDGRPWQGIVDVVSGGFPCQDISAAGKRAGINGERSGLWKEYARIIGEVRPKYAFIENSPMLTIRGGVKVIADLAYLGYNAEWGIIGADSAGAPHLRKRIWIFAYSNINTGRYKQKQSSECESKANAVAHGKACDVADSDRLRRDEPERAELETSWLGQGSENLCNPTVSGLSDGTEYPLGESEQNKEFERPNWWTVEPDVGRVAHGVAARVDRLKAIGNGQVPRVVQLAWHVLCQRATIWEPEA